MWPRPSGSSRAAYCEQGRPIVRTNQGHVTTSVGGTLYLESLIAGWNELWSHRPVSHCNSALKVGRPWAPLPRTSKNFSNLLMRCDTFAQNRGSHLHPMLLRCQESGIQNREGRTFVVDAHLGSSRYALQRRGGCVPASRGRASGRMRRGDQDRRPRYAADL